MTKGFIVQGAGGNKMALLEVKDLTREFKILNRKEGVKGAIKDLFSRDYNTLTADFSI